MSFGEKVIFIAIDGKEFNFYCETISNRSGFKHVANLFVDGEFKAKAAVQYYNRTWERYRYQTVCYRAIEAIVEDLESAKKREFMLENNFDRLTKKRREMLEAIQDCDELASYKRAMAAL